MKGFTRSLFVASLSLLFAVTIPLQVRAGSGSDAFIGGLLGGAIGSAVTNEYFNRRHYDRRYYGPPSYYYKRRYVAPVNSEGVRIQQALSANGYYNGPFNGNLDSYESRSAIMQYQQRHGLATTGVLPGEVKSLLVFQGEMAVLGNYLNYLGYERHDKTRRLQAGLKVLGFYSSSIDGVIGRGTLDAISLYQQSKGVVESGALMPAQEEELVDEAKEKLRKQQEQVDRELSRIADKSK